MIPKRSLTVKDFEEFIEMSNKKDWSSVISKVSNSNKNIFEANMEITMNLLQEYHNWLKSR